MASDESNRAPSRLGDRLVRGGEVSRTEVEEVAQRALESGERIGESLVAAGLVDERDVYRKLAEQWGLPLADLTQVLARTEPELYHAIPRRFLEFHHQIPYRREGKSVVAVTSEPSVRTPELAWALGADEVRLELLPRSELERLRTAIELGQVGEAPDAPKEKLTDVLARDSTLDAELVSLVYALLADAIGQRASDIHLECYGSQVRVRFRVDGDLHDVGHYRLSVQQLRGIVNVLKVSAEMDIAERRLPQGGRFATAAAGQPYDLRVQTQPSLHGEHVVVRLLAKQAQLRDIDALGFPPELAAAYRRLLLSPSGLVLVVGPTGSGKSTTLYAGLALLAADETRKVITVEDPIEYAIAGVQQTQVKPEIGFGFAHAMRAFVRQDPDVILVGEIRDDETALEALRASQTGHLVLSTLHCNDSVDAVQRLLDLKMHPNSIASELLAVFAQRLAKRICTECRERATVAPELLHEVFATGVPADFQAFRGQGCSKCQGRGTLGRIGVVEFLPASVALRLGISRMLPLDALRAEARRAGLSPFRSQALRLVHDGVIAFEELRGMLSFEQLGAAAAE